MPPRCSQMLPRCLEMLPRCPLMLPDPPRCFPDASQMPPDVPRCFQMFPRCLQMLPDASQMPPDASQMPPDASRSSQMLSRCLPDASRCLLSVFLKKLLFGVLRLTHACCHFCCETRYFLAFANTCLAMLGLRRYLDVLQDLCISDDVNGLREGPSNDTSHFLCAWAQVPHPWPADTLALGSNSLCPSCASSLSVYIGYRDPPRTRSEWDPPRTPKAVKKHLK